MSVQTLRRASAPAAPSPRRLWLLPTPRALRRTPRRGLFVAVLVSVLAAGLVALLLLNTVLAQQAFRLHDLSRTSTVLSDQESQLRDEVDQLTQPQAIAAKAAAIGMVAGCDPGFVRADGVIAGTKTRVTGVRHGALLVVAPPTAALTAPGAPAVPSAPAAAVCPGTPDAIAAAAAAKAAADKAAAAAAAAAQPGAAAPVLKPATP